jgi:hypothetical protein
MDELARSAGLNRQRGERGRADNGEHAHPGAVDMLLAVLAAARNTEDELRKSVTS